MGTERCIRRRAGWLIGRFLLASVIFSSCISQVWAAQQWYVGPGGLTTIQEAVDQAQPGDTIVVGPGTYSETVTIDKKIDLIAESIHEAKLFGSFIVKADDVSIDGFYVDGASDWDWYGIDIGAADVRVTNTIIETTGNEGVRGLNIRTDDAGVWEFQGSMDLNSREWIADGVYAVLADHTKIVIDGAVNVAAEDRSASGLSVEANDDLDISVKDVTVTADLGADGVFISGRTGWGWWSNGSDTTLLVDGDVTVSSEWSRASGVEIYRDYNTTATVTGDITVSGWDDVWGVRVAGFSDVTFSSGDVKVTGVEDAHGVEFGDEYYGGGLGDRASLTVGNVEVTATAGNSEADGLLIVQDDYNSNVLTVTTKDVVVRGGKRARGIDLLGGGDVALHVDGSLDVAANSDAYGMNVKSGNNLSLTVKEYTTVTAGRHASAIKIDTSDGAEITLGNVTANGVASATGADLTMGNNSVVNIGGSFDVSATGSNGDAAALKLSAMNNAHLRVGGDVEVATKRTATGVSARVRDNSTVIVEGLVSVTSDNAGADGVVVQGRNNLSVSTKTVEAAGANAWGIVVNADTYSGTELTVDGDVKVTGASGERWAAGITMTGGNDLSATITGDVDVTGGDDVVGVWIEGDERVDATLGGVRAEGGGEVWIHAVQFEASRDATLTIEGDVTAIGNADDSWVFGVEANADKNLTVSAKSVTATGGDYVVAVDMRGNYTFSAGDNAALTIDGDVKATVLEGGSFASGINLVSGNYLAVSVSGDVEASGGQFVAGASFTTLDGAEISLGDVVAKGGLEGYGVLLTADDGAALNVGKVTASAEKVAGTAVGLELWVGDEARIEVESIDVEAHGDAKGMILLDGGSDLTIDVAGGFNVRSNGPDGTAVGLGLDDFGSLELSLDGNSSVQAVGSATGVDIGADVPGGDITLRNLGTLQVSGSDAAGIRLSVGERAILENRGVIAVQGPAGGGIAVDARASAGTTELINAGVIEGDILLGTGNDVLEVASVGRIDGDVDLGSGDDIAIVYAGATLGMLDGGGGSDLLRLLDASEPDNLLALGVYPLAGDVASEVTARNFERVEIEGGRWTFGEGSDVATVEMNGGVLGGNSKFSGNLHNISGTVAPGNSFGVVTITGNYTQGEEALLSIEVRPASEPKPGVDHDQLVVGGTARFEAGTTIQVLPFPGVYSRMTRYVIVDGELEDFDLSAVNLDFPELLLLKGSLEEGSLVLLVERLSLESIAQSALQKAVAAALDKAAEDSGSDLKDMYDWFFQLSPDQRSEVFNALDSISGEAYGYLPAMAARGADRIGEAVVRGVSAPPTENRKQVWASAYSDSGKLSRESNAPGAHFDTRGFVTGADLISGPRLRMGIAAGGGTEALTVTATDGVLRGRGNSLGAYGRYDWGQGHLTLFAGYSRTSYVSDRHVAFGTDVRRAEAEFDAGSGVVWVEARYEPVKWGRFSFEPLASMGWISVRQSQVQEKGADNLNLTVEPYTTRRILGRVGLQTEMDAFEASFGTVALRAKIAWVNDFAPKPKDQTARWQGAAHTPLGIPVSTSPSSGMEVGLGIGGWIRPNTTWSLDYTAEYGGDGRRDRLQGQVGIKF